MEKSKCAIRSSTGSPKTKQSFKFARKYAPSVSVLNCVVHSSHQLWAITSDVFWASVSFALPMPQCNLTFYFHMLTSNKKTNTPQVGTEQTLCAPSADRHGNEQSARLVAAVCPPVMQKRSGASNVQGARFPFEVSPTHHDLCEVFEEGTWVRRAQRWCGGFNFTCCGLHSVSQSTRLTSVILPAQWKGSKYSAFN